MMGATRQRVRRSRPILAALLALLAAFVVCLPLALAPHADAFIYWTDGGDAIGRANLDGSGVDESFIVVRSNVTVGGVAVGAGHIYWVEAHPPGEGGIEIARARLDGTRVDERFLSVGFPDFFDLGAVDENHIYWSQGCCRLGVVSASIARANLDGTGVDTQFITGFDSRVGVAVDDNHIYWTEDRNLAVLPPLSAAIGRASLDGTAIEREFIPLPDSEALTGLAIDAAHLYWAGYGEGSSRYSIGRANLDGTGADESFIGGDTLQSFPFDLAVDAGHIYWPNPVSAASGSGTSSIARASLDGSQVDEGFIAPLGAPTSVAVDGLIDTKLRGKASASRSQQQRGKKVGIRVKVKARERLTARAQGEVKINPSYKLKPKKVHVAADKTKTLRLKPKKAKAKKIARALKRGEKAKAKLEVKLTDPAGNRETEKLRVRLR